MIVVVRPSKKSKMTMPSDWRLAAVGPIMACETNPSPEDSPTYRTWAYGDCSAGGGCSSFKQGAFYLPHGPQWKLCYSKLGVVLGKRLLSIGVYSGLWEALLGSLWNFSSAPNREGYSTTLMSDVQLFLWGQRYWFENDLFFLFVFFISLHPLLWENWKKLPTRSKLSLANNWLEAFYSKAKLEF